jgi:hypothetical protein
MCSCEEYLAEFERRLFEANGTGGIAQKETEIDMNNMACDKESTVVNV